MTTRTWDTVIKELEDAKVRLIEANRQESTARRNATDALNNVNALQTEAEKMFTDFKVSFPRGTRWAESVVRRTGEGV